MKKILLLSIFSLLVVAACKKKEYNPSTVVTASFPKITVTQRYYSIPVGGVRPIVQATAYDPFYQKSLPIVTIDSSINNFVAGFYTGFITSQNQYGYVSSEPYYVAVTNISPLLDLSGRWIQSTLNDSFSTDITRVPSANGLYFSNNVNGVNYFTDTTNIVGGYFVVTSPTTLIFDNGTPGTLVFVPIPGDTTMSYITPNGPITFSH
jgi:hypothetical protein